MSEDNWKEYDHYILKLEELKTELKCQPDDKEELREEQTHWVNEVQQKLDLARNAFRRMEQVDQDTLPFPDRDKEVAAGLQIVRWLKNVFELQDLASTAQNKSVNAGQKSSPSQRLSSTTTAVKRRKSQTWKAAQNNEEEEVDSPVVVNKRAPRTKEKEEARNSKKTANSGIEDSLPSEKRATSTPKTEKQGKNQKALRGEKLVGKKLSLDAKKEDSRVIEGSKK